MKKLCSIALLSTLLISGCATNPKTAVMPDGKNRTPVNTEATMQDYKTRTAEEELNERERSTLERKVDDLSRQVGELKTYILKHVPEETEKKAKPVKAKLHRVVKAKAKHQKALPVVAKTAEVKPEIKEQSKAALQVQPKTPPQAQVVPAGK